MDATPVAGPPRHALHSGERNPAAAVVDAGSMRAEAARSRSVPRDEDPRPDEAADSHPEASGRDAVPDLATAVDLANDLARRYDVALSFRTSEESGTVIVEVTDRSTGEVIREIPPEEMRVRVQDFEGFAGFLTRREA